MEAREDDDGLREDDLDDALALERKGSSEKKFMSIILTNLHVNYEGWRAELPKEEEEKGERKALEAGEEGDGTEGDVAELEKVSLSSVALGYLSLIHI